jgi:predicted TIM-barrel fold metal-dependent hydrolase
MSVTAPQRAKRPSARLSCIDCDIHPAMKSPTELHEFLPARWQAHLAEYGARQANPFTAGTIPYTRMMLGNGRRLDSWPPGGGTPGSDLDFMRTQHLDANGVEYGLLHPLPIGTGTLNPDLGAAICAATNLWQEARWTGPEKRLKGAITVAQENPEAAVAEIARWAGHPDFVQISFSPRTALPLGNRKYWPIFAAAVVHDLPLSLHNAATGQHAISGAGWPSFYIEDHYALANNQQALLASMILEGVFEQFPSLRVVLVEGGFGWVPSLGWRLDRNWARMRSEVPHVKRPPSEYMRENFWYTTQPMEEPERPEHLLDTIRWIGADRLLFSTDYPHWDFDDPQYAFKVRLEPEAQRAIMRENARALFRLA